MKLTLLCVILSLMCCRTFAQSSVLSFTVYNRGVECLKNNDVDSAIYYFDQSITMNTELSKAFYNIAYCYYYREEYDNCLRYIDLYMQSNITAESCFLRGRCNHYFEELDLAISDYNNALVFNPNMHEAYFYLGNIDFQKGNYQNAMANYSKAIDISGSTAFYYFNRGCTYKMLKKYDLAINDFNNAAKEAVIKSGIPYVDSEGRTLENAQEDLEMEKINKILNQNLTGAAEQIRSLF